MGKALFLITPLFLTIQNPNFNYKKYCHFDNFLLDYEGCHDSVFRAWSTCANASPLQAFSHAISRTKNNILRWRKSTRCNIEEEISNIEKESANVETLDYSSDVACHNTWLKALHNRHNALLHQNDIYWSQRAHVQWLQHGDENMATSTIRLKFVGTKTGSTTLKILLVCSIPLRLTLKTIPKIIFKIFGPPLCLTRLILCFLLYLMT